MVGTGVHYLEPCTTRVMQWCAHMWYYHRLVTSSPFQAFRLHDPKAGSQALRQGGKSPPATIGDSGAAGASRVKRSAVTCGYVRVLLRKRFALLPVCMKGIPASNCCTRGTCGQAICGMPWGQAICGMLWNAMGPGHMWNAMGPGQQAIGTP